MFAYGMMIIANAMIGNNATVIGELFTYLGVTADRDVRRPPDVPYRPMSWLAGEAPD